ncbi:hypothetical protein [Aliarcobacter butzleri]|uniref:hypothetical protein n=1 Tax=Aliarcobacter butzleri TaxID=28197 RepID=UPI001EDB1859|nr:hypothetical protein [Aliarcobacter butzleri]MCG3663019.1 hypothetical protein [Aliarcobacter butzleri]MCP3649342.1 hypothetical protein [Arcobacter sp. DNRA7]MCR1815515.1 hypothetical protein [Aliarcobacter butzleri]
MSEQRYDIVDVADDICKESYNFGLFGLKVFYKVSNLEALHQSFNAYAISRFSQTIEVFQHEHEKIDEEKRKEFYKDLKYNEQNLAYLYSMFEKARTSSFLIHSKILAWLSTYLVENKGLNYYQTALLANIDTLNELDFKYFYELLKENNTDNICTENPIKITVIKKFIQIGILSYNESTLIGGNGQTVFFEKNQFSNELIKLLDLIFEQKNS